LLQRLEVEVRNELGPRIRTDVRDDFHTVEMQKTEECGQWHVGMAD
jgi:hypothetical protein